jgi:hypothetical protein
MTQIRGKYKRNWTFWKFIQFLSSSLNSVQHGSPQNNPLAMALSSDVIFEKIGARLQKIDPKDRKIQHIYKFIIKKDGAVAKTWSE